MDFAELGKASGKDFLKFGEVAPAERVGSVGELFGCLRNRQQIFGERLLQRRYLTDYIQQIGALRGVCGEKGGVLGGVFSPQDVEPKGCGFGGCGGCGAVLAFCKLVFERRNCQVRDCVHAVRRTFAEYCSPQFFRGGAGWNEHEYGLETCGAAVEAVGEEAAEPLCAAARQWFCGGYEQSFNHANYNTGHKKIGQGILPDFLGIKLSSD